MRLAGGIFLFVMALTQGRTAPDYTPRDRVLIGTVDGHVVCLDAQNGAHRWTLDTGGPLVSKTGPPQFAPPFIPALTSDATLFRLQHDPPRLQKVNASLYSLLQPMHSEFNGHMLLTSKHTRLFEVDCNTGEPLETADSFSAQVVHISRHDVTIEGQIAARKGDWHYTASNLFMSQPLQAREDMVKFIDSEKDAEQPSVGASTPRLEVLVSGHEQLAVGVTEGRVTWQHSLPSRPVVAYLLQRGGLIQLPLLLYPLQRAHVSDHWRMPSLMVDSFEGLQYALVAKAQELPEELVVSPGMNRLLLRDREVSGGLTPQPSFTFGLYPLHFTASPGIPSLAGPPTPMLLEYCAAKGTPLEAEAPAASARQTWFKQWLKAVGVAFPAVAVSFFGSEAMGWASLPVSLVGLGLIAMVSILAKASWADFQWSTVLLSLNLQLRQEKEQLQHQTTLQSVENVKLKMELERRQQETEDLRRRLEAQAGAGDQRGNPSDMSPGAEDTENTTQREAEERPGKDKKQRRPRHDIAESEGENESSDSSSSEVSQSSRGGLMSRFFVKGDELSDEEDAAPAPPRSLYRSNFTELRRIAQGGFGKVFLVRSNTDQREYALKKIFLHNVSPAEAQRRRAEAVLSSKLDHRNVVRYYTSWVEAGEEADGFLPSSSEASETVTRMSEASTLFGAESRQVLYILMEYYSHGTLSALFQRWSETKAPINVGDVHSIFKQLVKGTSYLHGSSVLHRDLKPSNIFVARDSLLHNDTLKIGDFGLSCDAPGAGSDGPEFADSVDSVRLPLHSLTTGIGSPLYAAPEQISSRFHKGSYGEKADIFSLGIIFFECFIRPDTGAERQHLLSALRDRNSVPTWTHQKYPQEMALILDMTKANPVQRPALEEIGQRVKALCMGRKSRSPPFRPIRLPLTPDHLAEDHRPSSARRRTKQRNGTGSLSPPMLPVDSSGMVCTPFGGLSGDSAKPHPACLVMQSSYSLASDTSVESPCSFSQDPISPVLAALA